ncbi:MAG: AbrB/MazE/SpoVT family DNA-binding domain-containing protein [Candidatus Aenigmarchaeota archaeon]|nr:AbrB/MazE/SpoVT family DNA-binding domain-containing protein [Candidatus Aenigmarchaeota archaeon]
MDVGVTRMSSKGQIVIPAEMRQDVKEGDKMLIIKDGDRMILKKACDTKSFREDLIFAERTEDALKKYEKGLFMKKRKREFAKELKKW